MNFNKLEIGKPILSITGRASYGIIGIGKDDSCVYYKRINTGSEEKIEKTKLEEIKRMKEAGKKINTKTIKEIVPRKQSPALAILKKLEE